MRHSKWHFLLLASTVTLSGLVACGSPGGGAEPGDDDPGTDEPLPVPDPSEDYVFPDTVHSGFDGTSTFKVPLSTNLTEAVTWEVEDPSILDVTTVGAPPEYADFGETWAMVTTKKAGSTKVTAVSGTRKASATVVVEAYDSTAVAAGAARYTTDDPAGGQRVACISCHGLANGVDHSPLQMAYYADDEILSAITTGMYPDGYTLRGVNHAWDVTDAERAGIVPYLRSLVPRGF